MIGLLPQQIYESWNSTEKISRDPVQEQHMRSWISIFRKPQGDHGGGDIKEAKKAPQVPVRRAMADTLLEREYPSKWWGKSGSYDFSISVQLFVENAKLLGWISNQTSIFNSNYKTLKVIDQCWNNILKSSKYFEALRIHSIKCH